MSILSRGKCPIHIIAMPDTYYRDARSILSRCPVYIIAMPGQYYRDAWSILSRCPVDIIAMPVPYYREARSVLSRCPVHSIAREVPGLPSVKDNCEWQLNKECPKKSSRAGKVTVRSIHSAIKIARGVTVYYLSYKPRKIYCNFKINRRYVNSSMQIIFRLAISLFSRAMSSCPS